MFTFVFCILQLYKKVNLFYSIKNSVVRFALIFLDRPSPFLDILFYHFCLLNGHLVNAQVLFCAHYSVKLSAIFFHSQNIILPVYINTLFDVTLSLSALKQLHISSLYTHIKSKQKKPRFLWFIGHFFLNLKLYNLMLNYKMKYINYILHLISLFPLAVIINKIKITTSFQLKYSYIQSCTFLIDTQTYLHRK